MKRAHWIGTLLCTWCLGTGAMPLAPPPAEPTVAPARCMVGTHIDERGSGADGALTWSERAAPERFADCLPVANDAKLAVTVPAPDSGPAGAHAWLIAALGAALLLQRRRVDG